jgi:hypothetical protein
MIITKTTPFSKEEISRSKYMKNKIALESMAMDLKRAALGLHRGSNTMAYRFLEEAIKRKQEIDINKVDSYLRKIINNINKLAVTDNSERKAEDILMYSVLIQNYCLNKFTS